MKEASIILFKQKNIRKKWDDEDEVWYYSIEDILQFLTGTSDPKRYWKNMKVRLRREGNDIVKSVVRMKLNEKERPTDCADTIVALRIIQSVRTPKAEPFKAWLAKVGFERITEMEDPEITFQRAMREYLNKGYSQDWISQRLKSIGVRKELTSEWQRRGVSGGEFATLTDDLTRAWTNMNVKQLKKFKGLKNENVRDNMTDLELILNMLAETSTAEISKVKKPKGIKANKRVAFAGGFVAKRARKEIEKNIGRSILTKRNARDLRNTQKKSLKDGK